MSDTHRRLCTEAQARGWPAIASGRHTLIAAPTGSGKTLAAFLISLDGLVRQALSDDGLPNATQVVYVSPLKALANDIQRNLIEPLEEITALAEMRGVEIRKLKLIQDNYYTMKGSMPKRTMVGGAENIELQVEIDCDLDDAALHQFLLDATYASPLNGLMRGQLESLFKLGRNGKELATAKAAELDAPLFPDPGQHFNTSVPEASGLTLMEPVGATPKKAVVLGTASGGSSLADEQDRRLNIGAVAVLREDGIKEIQQMQYSPYGTSFRFLSAEDGRAPDANTLISAGIGFCFMTQFGRFVSMLKLDLPDYRIVQDTHFSLGGASGGTGRAGEADPIETHVYLQTGESEETAQEMLDISEQTCFLHAFCRTDLKTKLRVRRV